MVSCGAVYPSASAAAFKRSSTLENSTSSSRARSLLDAPAAGDYIEALSSDCRDIAGILQTVRVIRLSPPAVRGRLTTPPGWP